MAPLQMALGLTLVLAATGLQAQAANPEPQAAPSVVEKVERAVVRGAHAAASGVECGVKAAASGIERGAKAAAGGVERGVQAAASGVQCGAKATDEAAGKVARKVGIGAASEPDK
jgi:hypothetical protein